MLSAEQLRDVVRLTEVGKHVLDTEYAAFISRDKEGVVLQIYGNDGTPVRVNLFSRGLRCGGQSFRREGGQGIELFVQASFCRRLSGGVLETAVRLTDPVPLTNGKTAPALFSSSLQFFNTVRSYGHVGIVIEVKIFDRAAFSPLRRLFAQFHIFQLLHKSTPDSILLYLQEWPVFIPCVLHDLQNSQKWSLYLWISDQALMKDVHIGIESARNGYDLLLNHLAKFILTHFRFVPPKALPSSSLLQALWTALGADPITVEILVSRRVIFRDGRLCISSEYEGAPDLLEEVSRALLCMWRVRGFSDSRWLTLGRACRPIVAGFCLGLPELVLSILGNTEDSNYYLGGFRRLLDETPRKFVVVSALTSWVLDSVFELVLSDDRMLRQIDQIEELLAEQIEYVQCFDPGLWELLASVAGESTSAWQLRDDTMSAVHTAYGFFWYRCLRRLRDLPISLAVGCIETNLQNLVDGPALEEPVAAKIRTIVKEGLLPTSRIVAGVDRFKDVSFSNRIVEQVHAYAQTSARFHNRYSLETVRVRSYVSLLNLLLPKKSGDEKKYDKLRTWLARIERRQPNRVVAQQ